MSGRRGEVTPLGAQQAGLTVCDGCGASWLNAVGYPPPRMNHCALCPKPVKA